MRGTIFGGIRVDNLKVNMCIAAAQIMGERVAASLPASRPRVCSFLRLLHLTNITRHLLYPLLSSYFDDPMTVVYLTPCIVTMLLNLSLHV